MKFLKTLLVPVSLNLETATAIHYSVKLVYGSGGACQGDCNPEMVALQRGEIKNEWGGFFDD